MRDAREMNISDLQAARASGSLTTTALVATLLEAAKARAGDNIFITLDEAGARAVAAASDAAGAAPSGPLQGVPLVIKDNIAVAGLPNTAGTPALKDWVPATDAPVVARLRAAGAIILGKTNMHELAFGITSNNSAFGAVANAYAPDRIAGGSSGGTGAAIGARLAPAGLGTDTGGSVRIPAALNGISALRPTVGRYPGAGIVPIARTRDTAGPMARSIADLALLDAVITGTTNELPDVAPQSIRLGLAAPFTQGLDPATAAVFETALDQLRQAGVTLVPVDLTHIRDLSDRVGIAIALYEIRRDMPEFLAANETGVTLEGLAAAIASPDVAYVFSEYVTGAGAIPDAVYREAMQDLRPRLQAAYAEVFTRERLDALVFPTVPLAATPIATSDRTVRLDGVEVPTFPTFIRNTDPGSNAAIPGISLPAGVTADGLPVGLEIDGPAHSDRHLLAVARTIETLLPATPPPALTRSR